MSAENSEAALTPPEEFARELIQQLYADLDGVLLADGAPAASAFAAAADAARSGAARGAVLHLLAAAALSAHRALLSEAHADCAPADETQVDALLTELVPGAAPQTRALRGHAERLRRYLAVAESAGAAPQRTLADAIHRLYDGLRSGDEPRGGRGLMELRSLLVHLDANAGVLDAPDTAAPARVLRPDRFHDWFVRYTATAREAPGAGEQAVATLTREGRIAAVVTRETHPLESAEQALRAAVGADHALQDAALARVQALLGFLDALRRAGGTFLGERPDEPLTQLSLITAAATAPLRLGGAFARDPLEQIARYNRRLLRGGAAAQGRAH